MLTGLMEWACESRCAHLVVLLLHCCVLHFFICLGSLPYFPTICHSLLLSWSKTAWHLGVCVICMDVQSCSRRKYVLVILLLVPDYYLTQQLPHYTLLQTPSWLQPFAKMTLRPAALRRSMPTGWQGQRGEPAIRSNLWEWKPIRINITIQPAHPFTVHYETLAASWTKYYIDFILINFPLNTIYIPRLWILFIWDSSSCYKHVCSEIINQMWTLENISTVIIVVC